MVPFFTFTFCSTRFFRVVPVPTEKVARGLIKMRPLDQGCC